MKLVSIIIPTYGGSDSLSDSIDSVLNQTYTNIEIIVVDDNNPNTEAREKTEELMIKYAEEERVKYIKHNHNRNGAAARNTGFKYSNGEYICLLDDDDVFLSEKVDKQAAYLSAHSEFGACYCWRKQKEIEICCSLTGDLSQCLLEQSFTPTTCSIMIRRECYESLGGFDESYQRHQDYEFLLRFFKYYSIGVVEEVLLEIRGNEVYNQLRGQKLYDMKALFFSQFEEDVKRIDNNCPGFRRKVYASHFSESCKELIRYGDFRLAIKMYFKYGIVGGWLFWRFFFRIVAAWVCRSIKHL